MAADRVTPVDELTGLPLPLVPSGTELPDDAGEVANWHHAWHPRSHPNLRQTMGGRALRASRLQLVDVNVHNVSDDAYHRVFEGPTIPSSRAEQFGLCILSCAGYIPEKTIDMHAADPAVPRVMTAEEQAILRAQAAAQEPKRQDVYRFRRQYERKYRTQPAFGFESIKALLAVRNGFQADFGYHHWSYGYDVVKDFMADFVLSQDLSDVRLGRRIKFVEQNDLDAGEALLNRAIYHAIRTPMREGRTVSAVYLEAAGRDRLHPRMPDHAQWLVYYKLGNEASRVELLERLRARLASTLRAEDFSDTASG